MLSFPRGVACVVLRMRICIGVGVEFSRWLFQFRVGCGSRSQSRLGIEHWICMRNCSARFTGGLVHGFSWFRVARGIGMRGCGCGRGAWMRSWNVMEGKRFNTLSYPVY